MKNKKLIIIIVVVAVVVLSIIAYYYFTKTDSKISVRSIDYPNGKLTLKTPFGDKTFSLDDVEKVVSENNDYQLGVRKSIDWKETNGIETINSIGIEVYLVHKNENSKIKLETYKFYPTMTMLNYSKI